MKFSVITVAYNAGICIERTILSVISQSYKDMEYIIVDGSSNDNTIDIVKKYKSHINIWVSEHDHGIYDAMNKGVRMASGDYCIFMNAGDMFVNSDVLNKVNEQIESNFDIYIGNEISVRNGMICDYIKPPKTVDAEYLLCNSLSHQASFINRWLLLKNPYDENLKLVSDWKFWIQTIVLSDATYKHINVDICLFNHDGVTFTMQDKGLLERKKVCDELLSNVINNKRTSKLMIFAKRIKKLVSLIILNIKYRNLKALK